ncbi:hypothetical protein BH10BAC5_BH10BAC5_00440 [soil metagenome]
MKPIKLFFAAALITLLASNCFSQGLNSISSSDISHVVAVGDNGNMFRSTNGGTTWAKYTIAGYNLKSVATFGLNVWIAADNGTILSGTMDNSVVIPQLTGSANTLNSVYFVDNFNGYTCGNSGTVYKTTNGGTLWTPASGTIPAIVNLKSIAFRSNTEGVVVGSGGKFYKTINGGTTWTEVVTGTTQNLNKIVYGADGAAIAGDKGTLLLYPATTNTITPVNTKIRTDIKGITGIVETSNIMGKLSVCGGGGFIRNNRNGNSKFLNFEINPMFDNLVDIFYADINNGYAVSSLNNAIIKTTNGGTNWNFTAGTTFTFSWVQKLAASGGIGNDLCQHPFDNNTVFCGYGNKIYVSRNRGENWTQISTVTGGSSMHSLYISPVDTNIWVCAITGGTDFVGVSTNYGVTWTNKLAINFSNYGQPLEMDWNNPTNFYFAPDNGGYWRSTNSGQNWTEISGNYPFRSPCDIVIMADSSNVQFVADGITGSGIAQIFKSTNSGVNWTLVHNNTSSGGGSEIPSMTISQLNRGTLYCTEWSGSNIYKTTNYGTNWVVDHSNGFSGWASDICHDDPTIIMTGSYGTSSSLSTNNGATFASLPTMSGGGAGAGMIAIDKSLMLSQETSNLYKLKATYSVLTSIDEHINLSSIPQNYSLSQNYPNPFNPTTNINFALPKAGTVSLKVYNQLGQLIETLAEGFRQAGSYSLQYDATKLSSGIYFYKLITSDGFVETKKMLLVK